MAFIKRKDIESLLNVGIALSAERTLDSLLNLILEKCLSILNADAATIFLKENSHQGPPVLRFRLVKNNSMPLDLQAFTIPLDPTSLAGYVACNRKPLNIADVYQLPKNIPCTFNAQYDQTTGYVSRSLLSVPMIDHKDNVTGVVQIWNKKKTVRTKITRRNVNRQVQAFNSTDLYCLTYLASQAAVAIENAILYNNITDLFEGFIRASVSAIEARDPCTFGHSERVATLTIGLCQAVDQVNTGPYQGIFFSQQQLQEIKYAALLHDFGKIGVREHILLKAKKLYPYELESILDRFDIAQATMEREAAQKKLEHLAHGGHKNDDTWRNLEQEVLSKVNHLNSMRELILASIHPTVLQQDIEHALTKAAAISFERPDGRKDWIFSEQHLHLLRTQKGSLSQVERQAIEAHVSHTYEFLSHIPWTGELQRIPQIALSHHEKLDGSGYPHGLQSYQIPIESRIMAIADIFDALVSRDRAYKSSISADHALKIIQMEAQEGKLDAELVNIFIQHNVYQLTLTDKL